MNYLKLKNSANIIAAIFGGLIISLPAIAQQPTDNTQQSGSLSKVNPCPSIFYEQPHTNQVPVPQGCPPNAFTQRQAIQGTTPLPNNQSTNPTPDQIRLGVGGEAPSQSYPSANTPGSVSSSSQYQNNSTTSRSPIRSYSDDNIVYGPAGGHTLRILNSTDGPVFRGRSQQQSNRSDANTAYVPPVSDTDSVNRSNTQSSTAATQGDRRSTTEYPLAEPTGGNTSERLSTSNNQDTNSTSSQPYQPYTANNSGTESTSGSAVAEPTGGNTSERLSTSNDRSQPYTTGQQTQSGVAPIPYPSQQQQPVLALAIPTDARISVRLVNETNAPITFQAVGDTAQRSLRGRSDVMLQGLRTPTTVTFRRADGGLLMVTPQRSSQSGMLELRLRETTDLSMDRTVLRVEQNGNVFLN